MKIPSLHATLTVTASPVRQEIQTSPPALGTNDTDSSVRGTYLGREVTGRAYVQQSGIWR